jgi:hypothetical protein
MGECAFCGTEIPAATIRWSASAIQAGRAVSKGGRPRRFCSDRCRDHAYRRRKAGLEENARPAGRRGRVPLGGRTNGELREHWQQVADELRAATEELTA